MVALVVGTPLARGASFTVTYPMPAFTSGTALSGTSTLGTFDFTSTPYQTFESIQSISITLSLYDLQTLAAGSGHDTRDYNNISLSLGGINTGLLLNGYGRNVTSTVTTTGTPTAVNGTSILAALAANNGMLSFGVIDATTNPSNPFDFGQGATVTSLTLNVTQPVPFSPSAALGFGIVGAIALFRSWPRVRQSFRAIIG